jgi:hypothetical protein
MAVYVQHQQGLVAGRVCRKVGGVVLDEVPDDGGQGELADPLPPSPLDIGDDLILEVDWFGEGLAGFFVRHLPPPVHVGDPFPDPPGGGSHLLLVRIGKATVGVG